MPLFDSQHMVMPLGDNDLKQNYKLRTQLFNK